MIINDKPKKTRQLTDSITLQGKCYYCNFYVLHIFSVFAEDRRVHGIVESLMNS